ncbi:adenosylcobinamide amidohydrolase [Viridibacillus sp. YIM B01967]|uniref:Adenosylcobinamide amidohydrolase n=1 Tax=Viridibacillus soli TaxID=2798301 RepID=A0ABS1H8D2_9BACL|nr:adenosylcobinamide amidohydrolase [Viridibacillus soli]MBK3495677.1 adenosylcobinamide amidohydrolase [Viridibacillus soli]
MLTVEHITGGYDAAKPIVQDVSFTVKKGGILGILGPNGSGKSTLLKVISGILPSTNGQVLIAEQNIKTFSPKAFARKIAVLPQLHAHAFSHTVRETVTLGRYPHQNSWFSTWSEQDEEAVQKAMQQTGVDCYEHTNLEFLSGGEQQRTFVAQALAQQADILLLDEPTNHLDIAHQRQLLDMIRLEAVQNGLTVVSVFHDMNLASLYCDQLLLMEKGRVRAIGEPHEVLKEQQIFEVYNTRVSSYPHPELPKPQVTLMPSVSESHAPYVVTKEQFKIRDEFVELRTDFPLKAVSSAVHNAGFGWFQSFVNRAVDLNYMCEDAHEELKRYLEKHDFMPSNTVAMMTAVAVEHVVIREFSSSIGSIIVAVTAGVGNAVDVSRAHERVSAPYIGTINTWVIINGKLTDESFMQAMITATEAKTKAMHSEEIMDPISNTIATGTSTDSLLIASTQSGTFMEYAGPITDIGKLIGRGVFETTVIALQDYKRAKGWI